MDDGCEPRPGNDALRTSMNAYNRVAYRLRELAKELCAEHFITMT